MKIYKYYKNYNRKSDEKRLKITQIYGKTVRPLLSDNMTLKSGKTNFGEVAYQQRLLRTLLTI